MPVLLEVITKDVPTAGTRVQVTASRIMATRVLIRARGGNTGFIYVGGAAVSASAGYELDAGESLTLPLGDVDDQDEGIDLSTIWLDASANGDDADIAYTS